MAVTITKTKEKAKVVPQVQAEPLDTLDPTQMTIEQLADAYGSLHDRTQAALTDPIFARYAEVEKELAERIKSEFEPTNALEIKGEHWHLDVGAAAKAPAKVKDMHKVRKFLGDKLFVELVSITLSNLKKYLNPEQLVQVLDEDTGYTDRRKIEPKFMG